MFDGGVGVDTNLAGKVIKVATNWVTHLQRTQEGATYSSTGWQKGGKAFVLGETAITKEGSEHVINTALKETAHKLRPTGEPEPWLKMAQKLLDDEEAAFTYLLCAGMAAPLMSILSHQSSLAISAFSAHSGAGKTTVLKTVRAAFSAPDNGMGLSDTVTAIVVKMGSEQGLPAIYDEIRGNDAGDKIVEIVFQIAEGKTKMRATQKAEVRTQYRLNTIMLCGTNIPISDYVNERTKNTNAGFARFLELELQPKPTADIETDTQLAKLNNNYGHFGPDLVRCIINNMDWLKAAETKVFEELQKRRAWSAEERFWLQGTTKILLAGSLMNKTGQLKVDLGKLIDYALKVVEDQKKEIAEKVSNDDNILAQLVDFYIEELLVTERFKAGRGPGTVGVLRDPARKKATLHVSVEDKALRVTKSSLRKFAKESELSYKMLERELKNRFNAKDERLSIGAGTGEYNTAAQRLVELDLAAVQDGEDLISSWLQGSGTASTPSPTSATPDS